MHRRPVPFDRGAWSYKAYVTPGEFFGQPFDYMAGQPEPDLVARLPLELVNLVFRLPCGCQPRNNLGMQKPSGATIVVVLLVGAVVLSPLLYFLSTGPVIRLVNEGYIDMQTAKTLYGPLGRFIEAVPSTEPVFVWYVQLWLEEGQYM